MGFIPDTPGTTTGALASAEDLAIRLGVPADDSELMLALRRVSARFADAVGYPVQLTTDDEHWASGDGTNILLLPGRPIIGDPVVEIDGTAVTDFQIGRRAGILRRYGGWPDGLDNIRVVYTHGWADIPRGIQDAVLDVAEAAAVLQSGIESIATGDESIKFLNRMIDTGTTATWTAAVQKYRSDGQQT